MPAKIAILIDAENVDPAYAPQIFSYGRSLGEVTVREIYGAGISLNEWADPILENTIHTNFTLRPNKFKNSSDIALVIGAMEVLFSSRYASGQEEKRSVDAVIIASSDCDFSPLAFHLRSAGLDVIGMGEPGRINAMWPKACTEFVPLTPQAHLTRQRVFHAQPVQEAAPAAPAPEEKKIEPAPAAAPTEQKPEPAPESKKKNDGKAAVKIAPNHRARIEIIRAVIEEEVDAHDGRVSSGELFKILAKVPNYKFDQQRSKRKPLDYLAKQFGEWFVLEPGEKGTYWISKKPAQESESAPEAEAAPAEGENAENEGATLSEQESALINAGIPARHAARAAEILAECKNLRDVYNRMRQAYGNAEGKKYYELIKAAFAQPEDEADLPAEENEAPTDEATEAQTEAEPEAEPEAAAEPEPAAEAEAAPVEEAESIPSPALQFLLDRGVAPDVADRVLAIVQESRNMFTAYNELRKVYGSQGRQYFNLVKKYKSSAQRDA